MTLNSFSVTVAKPVAKKVNSLDIIPTPLNYLPQEKVVAANGQTALPLFSGH